MELDHRMTGLIAFYHGSLTVADSAVPIANSGLRSSTYRSPADKVYMTLETAQIRWTVDGTTPTTAVGHLLEYGQSLTLTGQDIASFQAIRTGGTSGTLMITSWCKPAAISV